MSHFGYDQSLRNNMSFFPLFNILETKGFCTVHNFSPNNWEKSHKKTKKLWLFFLRDSLWNSKKICEIKYGDSFSVEMENLKFMNENIDSNLVILQLRKDDNIPKKMNFLPKSQFIFTKTPEWRATVGFSLGLSQTSYQGEINPFPEKGSLLTFHPFVQQTNIENYFVFVNLETSPIRRYSIIEIYLPRKKKFIDRVKVYNNHANIISLDKYEFSKNELPTFICRNMAGIPFGFGINRTSPMLSLEHTHPPASFTLHGSRFQVQKRIKTSWFNKLKF